MRTGLTSCGKVLWKISSPDRIWRIAGLYLYTQNKNVVWAIGYNNHRGKVQLPVIISSGKSDATSVDGESGDQEKEKNNRLSLKVRAGTATFKS